MGETDTKAASKQTTKHTHPTSVLPTEVLADSTPEPTSNYLDAVLKGVFEVPAAVDAQNTETVQHAELSEEDPAKHYIVADHTTVFIDDVTPENTVNFETQLDAISLSLHDEINPEQLDNQQFTFITDSVLLNDNNQHTEPTLPETVKPVESITIDSGIIISDEPLPILNPSEKKAIDTFHTLSTEFSKPENAATDPLPDLNPRPITLGLCDEYEENNVPVFQLVSDQTTQGMIQAADGCYHFYGNSILANNNQPNTLANETLDEPVIWPAILNEQSIDLTSDAINNFENEDVIEITAFEEPLEQEQFNEELDIEIIGENTEEIVQTENPDNTYPETILADVELQPAMAIDLNDFDDDLSAIEAFSEDFENEIFPEQPVQTPIITNVRFIPVKNTHQDWVFSVINFGVSTEQPFFVERRDVPVELSNWQNNDKNYPDFNFDIGAEETIENQIQIDEPAAITHNPMPVMPIAEAEPTATPIKIELNNDFDDFDFDFASLFPEPENIAPAPTPIEVLDAGEMPVTHEPVPAALESELVMELNFDDEMDAPVTEQPETIEAVPVIFEPIVADLAIRPKNKAAQTIFTIYPIGSKVSHPQYGEGTVQKIIPAPHQNPILQIEFKNHGKRLLDPALSSIKSLEKVSK